MRMRGAPHFECAEFEVKIVKLDLIIKGLRIEGKLHSRQFLLTK